MVHRSHDSLLVRIRRTALALVAAVLMLLPAACGSSGSSGGASGAETGILSAGAPLAGVTFRSGFLVGITGSDGAFQYLPGQPVTFEVGQTQLGVAVEGAPTITPLDLVPGAIIPTTVHEVKAFTSEAFTQDKSSAIHEMVNMLSLLQSLDRDKDASNGIVIDPVMADLVPALPFDRSFDRFETLTRLMLHEGYAAAVLDSARHVPWHQALDTFAAAQGVTPELFLHSTRNSDTNADTNDDRIFDYPVDGHGRPSGLDYDSNADGTVDSVSTWVYDQDGNVIRVAQDRDNDGTADETRVLEYDMHGRETLSGYDWDGDGTLDRATRTTYDDMGNATRIEYDRDGDGSADEITVSTFDDEGRPTRVEFDADADTQVDNITTYAYSPNTIVEYRDTNADNSVDLTQTTTHDDVGRVLTRRTVNASNVLTDGADLTYDAAGNLIRFKDHIRDDINQTEYDAEGRRTAYRRDLNGDGTWEYNTLYEYDVNGNLVRILHDSTGNGNANSIATLTYNGVNFQTHYSYDSNANGSPNYAESYTLDAHGNRLTEVWDSNGNGTPSWIDTYTYRTTTFEGWVRFRELDD